MKRWIALVLSICMMMMLAACSSGSSETQNDSETTSISTVENQPVTTESETDVQETESKNTNCTSACLETQSSSETTSVTTIEIQPVTTESETDVQEAESSDPNSDTDTTDKKILVAYFSCTGTTGQIAEWIASETGADIYEIVAADPYTDEDLNYNNSSSRANQEQADSSARPEIDGSVADLSQYDTIFLGYPIWHGQAPKIIYTFLESYDFSNVTIIPFCTSRSSGIGSSAENLHSLCDDSVTWNDGMRFSGDATEDDVVEWIESLNLSQSEVRSVGVFKATPHKERLRLCTPSACIFSFILQSSSLQYIEYCFVVTSQSKEKSAAHLTHNLCAVLPLTLKRRLFC